MFHRQNARQPIAAALLALLLALACAFSCIGLSGWASFRRQLAELDAQYTTVAYLSENADQSPFHASESGHYYSQLDDGSLQDVDDGTIIPSKQRVIGIAETAPAVLNWNTNILTAAHTPDQKGFSSGAVDPMAYVAGYDQGRYAQTVAAVRCAEVVSNTLFMFEWIDAVCRMDAYDLPEHSRAILVDYSPLPFIDAEGNPYVPFEVGKTYLVRGDFVDFEAAYSARWVEGTGDESAHMENYWYRHTQDYVTSLNGVDPTQNPASHLYDSPWQKLDMSLPIQSENSSRVGIDLDKTYHPYPMTPNFYLEGVRIRIQTGENSFASTEYVSVPEGSWPFWAEYEGDWRDFLNTEDGKVWRDEIIPCCETGHDSVAVLLTDNIQGLSQFCKEESALLEGRFITQEEYDTGAAVCMVGADYALYNDLKVGDTLTLDLYKPAYATRTRGVISMMGQRISFPYTYCMPLAEENRLDVTRDYTIVGLYSTPARPVDPDGHGFRGDTVLAPKASAPEVVNIAERDTLTPLLNTLVLKNGSIEEFEAYMAENGAANRFRYYDYGYSEIKESIEAMESSALRLAVLGGAAFLIGAMVFLLASFARMSAPARGLRLLGASPNKVTGDMLSALLPLTAAGVLLGGILGGLLYGKVCEAVLSQTLAPDWPGVAAVACLQLLALCAVAAVWAALTARRGLMKRKQE